VNAIKCCVLRVILIRTKIVPRTRARAKESKHKLIQPQQRIRSDTEPKVTAFLSYSTSMCNVQCAMCNVFNSLTVILVRYLGVL
jgi:hypothetical protein